MIRLMNEGFKTEEDKLQEIALASNVTAEVKTAVVTAMDSAVAKFKVLKEADLALTKIASK